MGPSVTANNMPNSGCANAPLSCKGIVADATLRVFAADVAHVFLGDFGAPVPRTTRPCMPIPSFLNHVPIVVCLGSKKQMSRIATGRVVTMMENAKVFLDRSVRKVPGDPVCQKMPARVIGPRTTSDSAVTVGQATGNPRPALIGSTDAHLAPESENVLRSERRDDTLFSSHDSLRCRDSWSGRCAA